MRTLLASLAFLAALASGRAATTINATHRFAYGANLGWMDLRGDTNNGAVIGEYVCSGSLYAANVGWIDLGHGTPANGIRYQNNSATDHGVNHDGRGNLQGCAYGANIGWLTFTNRDVTGAAYDGPKVDLLSGRLTGYAWSANAGWISLSNAAAFVQTDCLQRSTDTDGDGISDAWEWLRFGNLTAANATSKADSDGASDLQEYLADTDPSDSNSQLRITGFNPGGVSAPATITWTSVPTRQYHILKSNVVSAPSPWPDVGLGLIPPDAGGTTTRSFARTTSTQDFFRVQAVRPLSP